MAFEELPFINSSFREFPLDIQLALADYKLYGKKSYAFKNKDILHKIYSASDIIKYEDSIIVDAFDWQLKNNTKRILDEINVVDIKSGNIEKYIDNISPSVILCIFRSSEIENFKDSYRYQILERLFLSTSFLKYYIGLITAENCNSLFNRVINNNSTMDKLIELVKTEAFKKQVNYSLINYSIPKQYNYNKSNTVNIKSLFKDEDFLFCISSIWAFTTSASFKTLNKFGEYDSVNTAIGDGYTYNMESRMNSGTSAFIYKNVTGLSDYYGNTIFEMDSNNSSMGIVSMVFRRL